MKIGYVRVSTVEQNEARQVEALQKHDIERWYIEKISGKNLDRPKLQEMLDFAREAIPCMCSTGRVSAAARRTCWNWLIGSARRACTCTA